MKFRLEDMRQVTLITVILLAAGCRATPEHPYDDWQVVKFGPETQPPWLIQHRMTEPPKIPPERALSLSPIHKYTDPYSNYEYRLWVYDDDQIITVKEPGDRAERYATIEEKLFFLARVAAEWAHLDDEQRLKELRRVRHLRREQVRDGLDEATANKRDAIRVNKERLAMIEAQISANERLGLRPPEFDALVKERDFLKEQIETHERALVVMKQKRRTRDNGYDHKHLRYDIDILKIDDLFSQFSRQDLLLQNFKDHVPADWGTRPATMEISGKYLIAVQDRAVLDKLLAHIQWMREHVNRGQGQD